MADVTLKMVLLGEDKTASKALKGVGDAAGTTGSKLGGFKGVMLGLGTAAAAKGLVDFGKASLTASRGAAEDQRKLDDAFSRFPNLADTNAESLRGLNEAIQAKTGADADSLAASQATLAGFGLTGAQISELTPLLDDYAAKTGKDLPDAANDLGKAMLGQGKALKGLGIDFTDAGSTGANFDQVMTGLTDKVGGFAEGEASSMDGKLKVLDARFGDVQEAVGGKLVPALTSMLDVGLKALTWMQDHGTETKIVAGIVGGFAVAVGLVSAAQTIAGGAAKVWAAGQWLVNAALTANPIGLVVVAIGLLVAALVIAYKKSETFRDIVNAAFDAVAKTGRWLWNDALQPAFKFIVNGFAWVMDGMGDMLGALGKVPGFGWAKEAADKMHGAAGKARDMAAGIKDIPDDKDVTVTFGVVGWGNLDAAARKLSTLKASGAMAARAKGGPISKGVPTLVGEEGPELIMPDGNGFVYTASQTRSMLSGGGRAVGGSGGGVDSRAIAAAVREGLASVRLSLTIPGMAGMVDARITSVQQASDLAVRTGGVR